MSAHTHNFNSIKQIMQPAEACYLYHWISLNWSQ